MSTPHSPNKVPGLTDATVIRPAANRVLDNRIPGHRMSPKVEAQINEREIKKPRVTSIVSPAILRPGPSAYLVLAAACTFQLTPGPTPLAGLWSATRDRVHTRTRVASCQFLIRTRKGVPGPRNQRPQGQRTSAVLSFGIHAPAPAGWLVIYLEKRESPLLGSSTMPDDTRQP